MSYTFSPIKKKYVKEVLDLLQDISQYYPKNIDYEKLLNRFLEQKNVYALVATSEIKVIAYGYICYGATLRGGIIGYIEDIVTKKEFRKKGVAKTMVQLLEKEAKNNGCYKVVLQCKDKHIKFYEKCGYKVNGCAMQRLL